MTMHSEENEVCSLNGKRLHHKDANLATDAMKRPKYQKEVEEDFSVTANSSSSSAEDLRLEKIAEAYRTIIETLGEDADRDGLLSTPMRAAKCLLFMTSGYEKTAMDAIGHGIFEEDTNSDMVIVRDIEFHSLCEHHLVPFTGKIHIGYKPSSKILGISKLARIADVFSKRLQVQERLTRQIATAITEAVEARGVGVVIEATHQCMVMRGVQKSDALTVTSTFTGEFETNKEVRQEFLNLVNKRR